MAPCPAMSTVTLNECSDDAGMETGEVCEPARRSPEGDVAKRLVPSLYRGDRTENTVRSVGVRIVRKHRSRVVAYFEKRNQWLWACQVYLEGSLPGADTGTWGEGPASDPAPTAHPLFPFPQSGTHGTPR